MYSTGNEVIDNLINDLNSFDPFHKLLANIGEHFDIDLTPPTVTPTSPIDLPNFSDSPVHHLFEDALNQIPETPINHALGSVEDTIHNTFARFFDGSFSLGNALDALLGHNTSTGGDSFGSGLPRE